MQVTLRSLETLGTNGLPGMARTRRVGPRNADTSKSANGPWRVSQTPAL